jgi:hypothetical protein
MKVRKTKTEPITKIIQVGVIIKIPALEIMKKMILKKYLLIGEV